MPQEYVGARTVEVESALIDSIPNIINHVVGTTPVVLVNPDPVRNKALILRCDLHEFRVRPGSYVGFQFDDGDVNTIVDTISAGGAHNLSTGDGPYQIVAGAGALPNPLAIATDYYVFVPGSTQIQVCASYADAVAENYIDLTTTGAAVTHDFGTPASGWAVARDPAATISDGYGAVLVIAGQELKMAAPTHCTVVGFDAAASLSYYWA